MLAHILALAVGFASFSLYMAAFFFPEVHRKYDFIWSGVGMFYALVLWVCAGRVTGGVLLGQVASVSLLGWLGWQTLNLRRDLTPADQQTSLPGSAETVSEAIQLKLQDLQTAWQQRSLRLPLPAGLNKLPEQVAGWLSQTKTQTRKTADSTTPRKKRSASRARSPVELLETTADPTRAGLEVGLDAELEATTEAISEVIAEAEAETIANPPPDRSEPETSIADEFDDADEPVESAPLPTPEPAVANRLSKSGGSRRAPRPNLFANLRDRVQGRFDQFSQPKDRSAAQPAPSSPSLDELVEALEANEKMPEAVPASLEANVSADLADEADVDAAPVTNVDAIEVEVMNEALPLGDDAAPEEGVSVSDALIEAEINWEAEASSEPIEQAAINHQPESSAGVAEWSEETPTVDTSEGVEAVPPEQASEQPTEPSSEERSLD